MPSISAGTGPAAAILVGWLFCHSGNWAGFLLIVAGIGLSFIWAKR